MGMEEVETAAADTTSEHSSSPQPQHHAHTYQPGHMTAPNYPSKMTGTPLSFSDHHHHGQPTWEARNTQLASGRDLDDSLEFESGAPPSKRQRIENVGDQSSQMSPKTSVHVRRHHGDRPVGIAQPMQLQDAQQTEPCLSPSSASKDETELQKQQKSSSYFTPSSAANPFPQSAQVAGQPAAVTVTVKSQQSQSSGKFGDHESSSGAQADLFVPQNSRSTLDEVVYDSDQSQESQRFDKFTNESSKNSSSTERLTLTDKQFESLQESTASSETSSESTTQFIATYVTPNMKYLDSDVCIESSTNQSDVKSQDSPSHQYELPPSETVPGVHVSAEQPFDMHLPEHGGGLGEEELHHPLGYGTEKDYVTKSSRRSSSHLPSAPLVQSGLPLPPNKKWHLFVSHSTSSQDWTRDTIVARLTGSAHLMRVAACYQSMPDRSRYDDKEIQSRMRESCAILIALTPLYLKSGRCKKEWELAVRLHREGRQCEVIVAAVEVCSRPPPLKPFLYLDFIDRSKFDTVWEMLLQTLHKTVQRMLPPISSPHHDMDDMQGTNNDDQDIFSQEIAPIGGRERRSSASTDPSSHRSGNFHLEVSKSSSARSTTTSDIIMTSSSEEPYLGSYHQQMMADFEAMYEAMGGDNTQLEGEREGGVDALGAVADPRASKMVDISSTHELVSQVSQEERGREVATVGGVEFMEGSGLLDVEEGELSSDSSGETGGVRRKRTKKNESEVAKFYNKLAQPDADRRDESPIFYMRNFNNWVKSILIRSHLPEGATVLDLCCGKGGDMLKWKEGGIHYLICADISEDSVRVCEKDRYHSDRMIVRSTGRPPFEAEFIVADCCEVRLRDRYVNPARRFHVTSCQFSVHYSFESYCKAHMMLRNACENLRPGGYFIGTTVDSNEVVHRLRKAGQNEEGLWSIGNDIFTVTLDPSLDINHLPLFGARYNFKLHGVVDLPEFLVHFPLLVDMLKDFDMELVLRQNFYDFFSERRYNTDDIQLLHRMKAFNPRRGSMSVDEWEAIGLYLVFVFRKKERDRLRGYS